MEKEAWSSPYSIQELEDLWEDYPAPEEPAFVAPKKYSNIIRLMVWLFCIGLGVCFAVHIFHNVFEKEKSVFVPDTVESLKTRNTTSGDR
jgi:hypothetical protein